MLSGFSGMPACPLCANYFRLSVIHSLTETPSRQTEQRRHMTSLWRHCGKQRVLVDSGLSGDGHQFIVLGPVECTLLKLCSPNQGHVYTVQTYAPWKIMGVEDFSQSWGGGGLDAPGPNSIAHKLCWTCSVATSSTHKVEKSYEYVHKVFFKWISIVKHSF